MTRSILILLLATFTLAGCGSDPTAPGAESGAINNYLDGLQYDADALLNVQNTGGQSVVREVLEETAKTENDPAVGQKVYETVRYDLKNNFDKVAILRPTAGVIFPGALVKANDSFMNGVPDPAAIGRAPATFSIDLPGMGENGTLVVDDPTNANMVAAISTALEWWNANAFRDGYHNAANSAYKYTSAYSSEQSALDVGLNLQWASGEVSGGFNRQTSSETHVVTASYQQAFYTVTMNTPLSPESVFASYEPLSKVQGLFDSASPPAYIQAVTYGRILILRMETSSSFSSTDIEGAFNYGVGKKSASGDLMVHYQNILRESTVEVLTIGGDAQVAADVVTTDNVSYGSLAKAIRDGAVYTRTNPGVPISYVARFLSDNSVCRLGYTTEYSATTCRLTDTRIRVKFKDVEVVKDCDPLGGKGEFTFTARVKDTDGVVVWESSGSDELSSGDTWTLPVNEYTINLQNRVGNKFLVEFEATEMDGNKADADMNKQVTANTYTYQSGTTWNSLSNIKTITHGDGNCEVKIKYTLTKL